MEARHLAGIGLLLLPLATSPGGDAAAQDARRVALVIGNASYREAPLKNPVNDARAMAGSLRARGFEVLLRENATKSQMETAVADFGEKLTEGTTGLFFFAGHGMQVQGRNFLVPVDARITSEQRVRLETLDVDMVLDQMQAARAKVSMVILDACRNNPFERRFRSLSGGLAQINAPEGTLIAYATAPGKVAADGEGENGLYTQEFLKALAMPGLKVEDVFKQVRINVSRASNGMQVPWEASSLTGDFYFVPPALPRPGAAVPAGTPPPGSQSIELAFWEAVKNSDNPAELQAYLDQYPAGSFAPLARARMSALSRPAPAPAAPPPRSEPATQQQAALPPATGAFDGRYVARLKPPRGNDINAYIDVSRDRIVGFTEPVMGLVPQGVVCRLKGSLDETGVIQLLDMECGPYGAMFSGRFAVDTRGVASAETTLRSTSWSNATVTWRRN